MKCVVCNAETDAPKRPWGSPRCSPECIKKWAVIRTQRWRENNPGKYNQNSLSEAYKETARNWRVKKRKNVIAHYGGRCNCCGLEDYRFLTVDHIIPVGRARKSNIALKLEREGFPDGFQILCYNCNMAKRDSSHCPHQDTTLT